MGIFGSCQPWKMSLLLMFSRSCCDSVRYVRVKNAVRYVTPAVSAGRRVPLLACAPSRSYLIVDPAGSGPSGCAFEGFSKVYQWRKVDVQTRVCNFLKFGCVADLVLAVIMYYKEKKQENCVKPDRGGLKKYERSLYLLGSCAYMCMVLVAFGRVINEIHRKGNMYRIVYRSVVAQKPKVFDYTPEDVVGFVGPRKLFLKIKREYWILSDDIDVTRKF